MQRSIYVISTPPTAVEQISVTALLSDEELKEAKKERPDLIFTPGTELPEAAEVIEEEPVLEPLTVKGMTLYQGED